MTAAHGDRAPLSVGRVAASLLSVSLLAAAVAHYPLGPVAIGALLLIYAFLIWRVPSASTPLLLGALPLANLAPITGWLFITEFDLLVLATLTVRIASPFPISTHPDVPVPRWWLLTAVFASALASAAVGLLPLQPLDSNAFANYYSHYNALRELKGFVLGLVLFWMLYSDAAAGRPWRRLLALGMSLGLTGVVLAAIWERQIFPGLLDFSTVYRITGTLFEMHTGGGDIETYLAAAIPFALVSAISARNLWVLLLSTVLSISATYVMAVTYARGGYAAYAVGIVVLIVVALAQRRGVRRPLAVGAVGAVLALTTVTLAMPVAKGGYMHWRFEKLHGDAATRMAHWHDALDLIPSSWMDTLIGAGLGSFPERYFRGDKLGHRPGTYRYRQDSGGSFVTLDGGEPVYLGQRVMVRPGSTYRLVLDYRTASPDAILDVTICEKSVLYSSACLWVKLRPDAEPGAWGHEQVPFNSRNLGRGAWYQRRPVELALLNTRRGTEIDVKRVSLYDASDQDLVTNGDFSRAGDFWFFTADDHLPWHIKSLPIQLRFEQGWFGVFTVGALFLVALGRLARIVRRGDAVAAATLASISAMMVLGLFNSMLESPRLAALLLLLLFLGVGWPERGDLATRSPAVR